MTYFVTSMPDLQMMSALPLHQITVASCE